ncbi:acyltransferase family protein [Rhizobium sp. F40D2]|uniref:acyltransferase family protein n=1 Tax=Rhizobium sp. F40D2 TaxID=3453141 RepID=UPI003F258133
MQKNDELHFLTGIRGCAATAVMATHVAAAFLPNLPYWLEYLLLLGPSGVIVFFVISAFSISLSLERAFSPVSYAIKRLFRIAPAYYVMLMVAFSLGGSYWAEHFHAKFDTTSLLLHLTFLNWLDVTQANNAIGVEWTLSIEMLFYLLLPLMVNISRKSLGPLTLLAASLSLLLFLPHAVEPPEAWLWSPIPFSICFVAGVVVFRYWEICSSWTVFRVGALVPVVIAAAVALAPQIFEQRILVWTVLTSVLICSGRSLISKLLFENRIAVYLGKMSYSLYLVHPAAIIVARHFSSGWTATVLTILVTSVGAFALNRWVEVPAKKLGGTLARSSTLMKMGDAPQSAN